MNLLPETQSRERRFSINLTLTPAQAHIEANSTRFTFVRGGRKFGKTKFAEYKALKWLGPPGSVHWHIAPTYKQAKLISWDSFKRLIPQQALLKKPNDQDLTIHLKNDSQLYLMGSDEPDTLRGPAPTSMTLEEAAYHKANAWHDVLRPNLTVHRAPALFISSPRGFNWFKDMEDEAKRLIALGDPEWSVFHYTIYDNPYISRDEIERILASTDPMVWRQEYMAEYESAVGRVFNVFQDTERHVRKIDLPRSFDAWRGIDWGMRDNTGAVWGTIFEQGKLYVYREHAENGLSPASQANIIIQKTPANERIVANILSHDAVKQDVELKGMSVLWHMINAGMRPIKPSSRDKAASRAKLQQLFQEDRIVIDPECRKLRKQLLSYEWKDTAMEKTDDGDDDLVDALHYLVELLQYQLFLEPRKDGILSDEQKRVIDRAEKIEQKRRKWPMEQRDKELAFSGPAGYL